MSDDAEPTVFYKENGAWPFAHSLMGSMIIFQVFPTENAVVIILAALLVMYFWESIEKLSSFLGYTYLQENIYDSLLGDPLVGGLSIVNYWLLDRITDFDVSFRAIVPLWLRIVVLFIAVAPVLWIGNFRNETYRFRYQVIGYAAYYILIVVLLFSIAAGVTSNSVDSSNVLLRMVFIIIIVVGDTFAAAIIEGQSSTFIQVVGYELVVFFILILILSIKHSS